MRGEMLMMTSAKGAGAVTPSTVGQLLTKALRPIARRSEYLVMLLGLLALFSRAWSSGQILDAFSFDSFRYLAGAEAISQGLGYRSLSGGWSLHYPSGFSSILAAASLLTHQPPETLFAGIQAAAYVVSGLALGSILRRAAPTATTLALASVALLLNRHFLSVHSLLWSEPWAVAFALVSIALCLGALKRESPSLGVAAGAGLAAGLAVGSRWAMLAVPAAGAVALWLAGRGWRRTTATAAYLGSAALVLVLALTCTRPDVPLDHWTYDGSNRAWPALGGFADLADQMVPRNIIVGFFSWSYALLLVGLGAGGAYFAWADEVRKQAGEKGPTGILWAGGVSSPMGRAAMLLALTAVAYLGICLAAPLAVAAAQPVLRILFPLLLFLVPAALLGSQHLAQVPNRWRALEPAIRVVLIAGLAVAAVRAGRGALDVALAGLGDHAGSPRHGLSSVAVAELRDLAHALPQESCVVTNAAGLAWYSTRLRTFAISAAGASIQDRCNGVPVLVAFLRPGISELERFVEYSGPLSCHDLAGSCSHPTPDSFWTTAVTDPRVLAPE